MAVPRAFLAKIMKELVDRGLVDSQPGRNGGYSLARPPSEISFRDILEGVEGPLSMVPCQEDGAKPCLMGEMCTQVPIWDRIRWRMLEVFAEYTLDHVKTAGIGPSAVVVARPSGS